MRIIIDNDLTNFFTTSGHIPKEQAHLTVRCLNGLVRGGVTSMEKLAETPPEKLIRLRGLGVKSLALAMHVRDSYIAERAKSCGL